MIELRKIRQTIHNHKISATLGATLLISLVTGGCSFNDKNVKEVKEVKQRTPQEVAEEKYWSSFTVYEQYLLGKVKSLSISYYSAKNYDNYDRKNGYTISKYYGIDSKVVKLFVAEYIKQQKKLDKEFNLIETINEGFNKATDIIDRNIEINTIDVGYIGITSKENTIKKELAHELNYEYMDETFSSSDYPFIKSWLDLNVK